jgi:hypothetical protein
MRTAAAVGRSTIRRYCFNFIASSQRRCCALALFRLRSAATYAKLCNFERHTITQLGRTRRLVKIDHTPSIPSLSMGLLMYTA